MNIPEIFLSQSHPCDYLSGEISQFLFLSPDQTLTIHTYSQLVAQGFRRSGCLIYRPHCSSCHACIPARIPVDRFIPKRCQKRTWHRNQDLKVIARSPEFYQEHYDLYIRYLQARHQDGNMVDSSPEDYLDFITCPWCETLFYEFRLGKALLAVAVADLLEDGLSAVYTFFDPNQSRRGLGTFAILAEIEAVRRLELQYLYLGYWIENCAKMSYKTNFRPLEIFKDGYWLSGQGDRNQQMRHYIDSQHQRTSSIPFSSEEP